MTRSLALIAVASLALAGCATQEPTKVADSDCRTVSFANGMPMKAQYQYWNKGRMDPTTDEYRRHHGDCRG